MKLNIVFRKNGKDIANGKAFEIELEVFPRLNEHISFDYIESDESFKELYSALDNFKTDYFLVTEVYHSCGINVVNPIAALIFVEAEA